MCVHGRKTPEISGKIFDDAPGSSSWTSLALSSDARFVAAATGSYFAAWDRSQRVRSPAPNKWTENRVLGLHFDPVGHLLIVGVEGHQLRVGSWDIPGDQIRVVSGEETYRVAYASDVAFSATGSRCVTRGDGAVMMWELADGLRELKLGDAAKVNSGELLAQLDADGNSLFLSDNSKWWRWDMTSQSVVTKGSFQTFATPLWSPDGRWRAEVQGQSVLIWGSSPVSSGPAKTISPACQRRDKRECVAMLCQKLQPALTEDSLRNLFGTYDEFQKAIGGPLCSAQ